MILSRQLNPLSKRWKIMWKHKLMPVMAIAIVLAAMPGPARAVELGLTPSHVYSLWTNINAALVTLGPAMTGSDDISKHLEGMTPSAVKNKTPGDVLGQVAVFRTKLDRIGISSGLKATQVYSDPKGGKVTPSVVFLNSGNVLDSLVLLLIRTDDKQLVSGFYKRHEFSGKTPSNVFSLVELANRRMDALIRKTAG